MAVNYWIGTTGNATTNANWSAGTAAAAAEFVTVDYSDLTVTTFAALGSGVAYGSLYFGPNFRGSWGTAGNPFPLDDCGWVEIDAPQAKSIALSVDNTDVVPRVLIKRTNNGVSQPVIIHGQGSPGTITALIVGDGCRCQLLTGATVTTLYVGRQAVVTLDSGALAATIHNDGGIVHCAAAATTVHNNSGTWNHNGTVTGAITTVNNAGTFNFHSPGFTIGTVNQKGGHFHLDGHEQLIAQRTVTAFNQTGGTLTGAALIGSNVTLTADAFPYGGTRIP